MTNTPPLLSPTVALRSDYASHGSPVAVLEAPGNVPASHGKSHYDKGGERVTRKAGFKVPTAIERRGILRGYEEAVATVYDLLLSRGNDKDDCLALCRYVMALRDTVYGTGDGEPIGMLNAVAKGAGAKETP